MLFLVSFLRCAKCGGKVRLYPFVVGHRSIQNQLVTPGVQADRDLLAYPISLPGLFDCWFETK